MNDYKIIRFTAPWCGPCKQLGPIFEELAKENPNPKITYQTLNIEEHEAERNLYFIRGIPTILILKNDREVGRIVGFRDKDVLKDSIDSLVKKTWQE